MRSILGGLGAACIAVVFASAAPAAVVVKTINPADPYVGYMNVSNLPADGGAYQFGSSWGTQDLRATFTGGTLMLQANNIGDTSEYWYKGAGTNPGGPGAPGNKQMEANMYVDTPAGVVNGDTLTFSGNVLQNTFVSGYQTIAFIKDFAPDYSSSVVSSVPLAPGVFSISLATIADPARHIQFGFQTVGANAWVTDADAMGFASIVAVPEPMSMGTLGAAGLLLGRRRRA